MYWAAFRRRPPALALPTSRPKLDQRLTEPEADINLDCPPLLLALREIPTLRITCPEALDL